MNLNEKITSIKLLKTGGSHSMGRGPVGGTEPLSKVWESLEKVVSPVCPAGGAVTVFYMFVICYCDTKK